MTPEQERLLSEAISELRAARADLVAARERENASSLKHDEARLELSAHTDELRQLVAILSGARTGRRPKAVGG